MDVGPPELLIILVIALVLFGGAKLPQLAKSLGSARKEYERGLRGETEPETETEPAPPAGEVTEVATTTTVERTTDA